MPSLVLCEVCAPIDCSQLQNKAWRTANVKPKMMSIDSSRPDLVEEFSKITFIGMIGEIKDQALANNLIDVEGRQKTYRSALTVD